MSGKAKTIEKVQEFTDESYKYGFVTNVEVETAPKGLSEDIIRFISAKKRNQNGCLNRV
jgi:Fe-S cluster assembly protein SufB